jgi:F0F1-type ATP synthase gamma subunit
MDVEYVRIFYKKAVFELPDILIATFGATEYLDDPTYKLLYERYLLKRADDANTFIYLVFEKFRTMLQFNTAIDNIINLGDFDYEEDDDKIPIYQITFYPRNALTEATRLINEEPNYHHIGTWYRNNACVYMEKAIYVAYCINNSII